MYYKVKQIIPVSLDAAWSFFTDPANLDLLTPGDMKFSVTSPLEEKGIYPGMIITYKVSPLLRIPMTWMTEIVQVQERKYFIDDQKSGPFKIWHHQHHFREIDDGVEMIDIVYFKAPFGILGRLAEKLIVRNRVKKIFAYRKKILKEIFG